ncbi:hypothetical protein [Halalkalicoccus jeotgali]|uniref:Uncharacterized protein n=1 Tax=Halalkalicoccus jeotgali (strain DSM 18796 / CECT 7217 / JCM 14584 / KCTC 4019 / B3) TaxID=795797 RepID=D8J9T9_HALJB|nr:hypothetical protein [Halalkalicoccus jeotgali]ADJ14461.1 hypothetical protein HacjB3_05350 [Halalkalicoccus jeotgali B3]ELY40175.1 hypothetical protein C497_03725 [Halalkalicoccus jeotgali B3]
MIGLSNYGKEYMVRRAYGDLSAVTTLEIGLYDDVADRLSDADDLSAITSEPQTGEYARLAYALDGEAVTLEANANGDWRLSFAEQEFDLTNTTGISDAWFVAAEFAALTDDVAQMHLIGAAPLRDQNGTRRDRDLDALLTLSFAGSITQTG